MDDERRVRHGGIGSGCMSGRRHAVDNQHMGGVCAGERFGVESGRSEGKSKVEGGGWRHQRKGRVDLELCVCSSRLSLSLSLLTRESEC